MELVPTIAPIHMWQGGLRALPNGEFAVEQKDTITGYGVFLLGTHIGTFATQEDAEFYIESHSRR